MLCWQVMSSASLVCLTPALSGKRLRADVQCRGHDLSTVRVMASPKALILPCLVKQAGLQLRQRLGDPWSSGQETTMTSPTSPSMDQSVFVVHGLVECLPIGDQGWRDHSGATAGQHCGGPGHVGDKWHIFLLMTKICHQFFGVWANCTVPGACYLHMNLPQPHCRMLKWSTLAQCSVDLCRLMRSSGVIPSLYSVVRTGLLRILASTKQ